MIRRGLSFVGAGVLLVLGSTLISCAPDTSAPSLVRRERTPTVAPGATLTQIAGATPVAFTDTACLDCHTDKAQLVALAKPLPVVESESEGPG